jgi:predicted O-methyltransferase YrrM
VSLEQWTEVDRYIGEKLVASDEALDGAQHAAKEGGLPPISVSAAQGKLLQILVQLQQAKKVLEIGTLGGYSSIWMARALPADGRLITLEIDPKHAEVAQASLVSAGVADKVEIRLGAAIDTLPKLEAEGAGPFDLVFIDADKASNADYFTWAVKLSRKGTMIIVDNVVRNGAVLDSETDNADIVGTRRLFDTAAAEGRVNATAIQTVGAKGYDGFVIGVVDPD